MPTPFDFPLAGANEMVQTDLSNNVEDPSFERYTDEQPTWNLPAGVTIESTDPRTGAKHLRVTDAANGLPITNARLVEAYEADRFYVGAWAKRSATGAGAAAAYLTLECLDAGGSVLAAMEYTRTLGPTNYTLIGGPIMLPLDTVSFRARLKVVGLVGGTIDFDDVRVFRIITTEMLEEGIVIISDEFTLSEAVGANGFAYFADDGRLHTTTPPTDGDILLGVTDDVPVIVNLNDRITSLAPTPTTLLTNLAAYWKLDEASGNALDAHGSSNLVDTNTVTSVAGKRGTARQFTRANNEALVAADSATLSTGNISFTLSVWVYFDTVANGMIIVNKDADAGREFALSYDGGGGTNRILFYVFGAAGNASVTGSSVDPLVNTWYHVIAWHDADADTVNMQINNGTIHTSSTGGLAVNDTTTSFIVGGRSFYGTLESGAALNGRLDELGFWKRLLTASERLNLYNGGLGLTYPLA